MGELEAGDEVLGRNGEPVRIMKATEWQHDRDCFDVKMADGEVVTSSDGHLWLARPIRDPALERVWTTGEMYEDGRDFEIPLALTESWTPIASITPTASVAVRCIAVDSEDRLFLAGMGGHVTHNTHLYTTPELHNAYDTLTRNLVKRRGSAGTFFIETTTMYSIGSDSVAERNYELVDAIRSGKFKGRVRALYDHQYSDITPDELGDADRVREALTESYGDSLAWNDLDSMVDQIMDPRNKDITASFRYWFNARFASESAFIAPWSWEACGPKGWDEDNLAPRELRPGDQIVLGFDGSRGRKRGIADATALMGCRVSDGFMFPIEIWEQPLNYHKQEPWMVPIAEVDATVRATFKKYKVIAFFCDPAYWTPTIADWEARYGSKLPVKATAARPLEFWTGGSGNVKKMVDTLGKFEDAILDRELRHSGDLVPYGEIFTQHVLNARRRQVTQGVTIGKETANSSKHIDACIAAAIAWSARLAAVAAGYGTKPKPRIAVKLR